MGLTPEGNLEILFGNHTLYGLKPMAYQEIDGQKTTVDVDYEIVKNLTYGYSLGGYDVNHPLVIAPSSDS